VVRFVAHRHEELGGQDDAVTAPGEGVADDAFGLAGGVDVGGVDEVDAGVQSLEDDADRVSFVGISPRAEQHRAQAQGADRYAGQTEVSVLHGHSSLSRLKLGQRFSRRGRPVEWPGVLAMA